MTGLPDRSVQLAPPDLRPWLAGNGLPGVITATAETPGPHTALVALIHGNEIAGAIVLDQLLRDGLRPARGRLTLVFANLLAFGRFDAADPTASRFVEEDLNRVWHPEFLDGPRRSAELRRARDLRPVFDTVDLLLDLHTMLWPSDPLLLAGSTERGRALARAIGVPPLVVADRGHAAGPRLLDYGRFGAADGQATALLVEGGSHWQPPTVQTLMATTRRFLALSGIGAAHPMRPSPADPKPASPPRVATVTHAITARGDDFAFLQPVRGGDVIARRNSLLALDGDEEIRTPYDNCLLVMPSPMVRAGQTAVRLARVEG